MMDLDTVLIVCFAIAGLQALAWIFVWRAWRHLYELRFLAAGFAAIALGLLLMILRGGEPEAWAVVLANIVIKLGLVMLADGLARFLGQPRRAAIGIPLLVLYILSWTAAVGLDPANVAIRIHLSTLFTAVMMSVMILCLLRDRTQPASLRWIMIGFLAEYMIASFVQSAIEPLGGGVSSPVLADRHAWYLLQGSLFQIVFFACLLFMVSARLSADLQEKNEALSREITERRRLEARLGASIETERALRDEQSDFMRIVSHEFRTPLAIIRSSAEMIGLAGDPVSPATRERVVGIGEALDRLFGLIDRFMADDRANGFRPELLTLAPLLETVRLHFAMTGQEERLNFSVGDGGVRFFADPEMLATAIINLVDNALKYSDRLIGVDARESRDGLVIAVSDHGIGIPEAERSRIGRRFFRASNAVTRAGTGLGLYSSQRLLAYHGGTLQLLSNEGGGTVAVIRLPRSLATGQPQPEGAMA
ncbi:HAMP domain-containing sensor histidine kinase [Sphingopyxis sp.]|uniref:sensor histidine kinase n=1 Tax=Sphingopyxis sp. TaxID=1908224 RepID=UPI002D793A50|nr:HAMP domain-containing sensor histidine kinase [Sphingopyxis sp.]HET6527105.1 HAMP domain-containing sensor histidine kinase [Sphingopyxis sp.]